MRAREIAAQTGTAIVVNRGGMIEHLYPKSGQVVGIQEPATKYEAEK
jgi:hypothetical protein